VACQRFGERSEYESTGRLPKRLPRNVALELY